jgi:hypothetical protein
MEEREKFIKTYLKMNRIHPFWHLGAFYLGKSMARSQVSIPNFILGSWWKNFRRVSQLHFV